ncbi:MAG: hypothetical protein MUE67_03865 [Anaerolineales bacterium]|jgi:YHS domain-containing protein|nr:hypothetical protein [Anaerolineales bacterium]
MNLPENPDPANLKTGDLVFTACGGRTEYAPWIAQVIFQGRRVYFCSPACKLEFEQNPTYSCLAAYLSETDA